MCFPVITGWKQIFSWPLENKITHQLDPNRPCTNFPSKYLIALDKKKNDSSSSKKQGHEMCGVLLTLLFYMLLMESAKKLTDLMG